MATFEQDAQGQSEPAAPETGAREKTSLQRKIMVAVDDKAIADIFCLVLRPHFNVRAVYSGEEILSTVLDFRPEVLLSYIFNWGITGVEAAIRVREMLPSTRIMLFSGSAEAADILNQAADRGYVFEVFGLPFDPHELLAALGAPKHPTCQGVDREPAPVRNELAEPDVFQRAIYAGLRFLRVLR